MERLASFEEAYYDQYDYYNLVDYSCHAGGKGRSKKEPSETQENQELIDVMLDSIAIDPVEYLMSTMTKLLCLSSSCKWSVVTENMACLHSCLTLQHNPALLSFSCARIVFAE
ncbi:hypothetical protein OJAV_G00137630 [Oryzias javanicus]|uniref:Uncharacterized protein n=1 Tax=Oryzias javanicus TaxID=123683 RepID=A0A3S2P3R9_ORYJA|nr:hypothetical protein OJAV_G00137630 [Oryzias javanicus]